MTAATTLLIGLGSNWHATANLRAAETALRNLLPSLRLSTPQWTAPLQNSGPDYLNAVAAATTPVFLWKISKFTGKVHSIFT